ncbi:VOC family protein [Pseudarthrobacter sp. J1738]|uniref:VOC family protein n=1 Tax=Pseudarthrobacter sp. J1738 TaxID=3420446 RepID=UPI003D2D78FE
MPSPKINAGAPCWIDLMTSDIEQAKEFYGELLGWTFQSGDEEKYGGYVMAFKDGKSVAGLMQKQEDMADMPDVWSTYLLTEDADATAAAVSENGGQVFMPPHTVPDQGRMAIFGDPSGAAIGAWEAGAHKGYEVAAEPGAPGWHELHTNNYPAAVEFYQKAFGWDTTTMADSPEFKYTTLGAGNDSVAGIYDAAADLADGAPSSWHVYFVVDSTGDSVTVATNSGAQVLTPAEDTPFGRMATLADASGAVFKLIQNMPQG